MCRCRKLSMLAIACATSIGAASAVQAADQGARAPAAMESAPTNARSVKAAAYKGAELANQAKFSRGQARAIALKAHPGAVTDEELEAEPGGSGLRYSFDIKDGTGTYEVGVDAITGKVLENKREGLVHD